MTLPANVGTVTVTGTFLSLANGAPAAGIVTFEPTPMHLLDASADAVLVAAPVMAQLDANGSVSVVLAATNDVDLNPVNWTYSVTVKLSNPSVGWRFDMAAPAGATINLADVIPVDASGGDALAVGGSVPTGGTAGQVLAKASSVDFATVWVPASAPGVHAATHAAGSSDPVTLTQAQITGLTAALAAKAATATTVTTTAPLTGSGTLASALTIGIADFSATSRGAVPNPTSSSGRFLKDDGTWAVPAGGTGGTGVTDGDKGDIVVSGSGASWVLDSTVVTSAAKTVLDDTTVAAMRTTLGAAASATTVTTTAPLTGTGTLGANLTLGISDFTSSSRGAVPSPVSSSGRFLKDDGTWDTPGGSISGAGGVFPFTYNATITEPPIGNQLRSNSATFTASTKLWVMETTFDGLDVAVGLSRIKAGNQVYVQDYDSSAAYALFTATADAVDKGTYWEISVALVSSAGTVPAGKVAFQSLTPVAHGIPSGGTTAQALTKSSAVDYAVGWTNVAGALNGLVAVWKGSQAQYDAIGTKDPNTLYAIV